MLRRHVHRQLPAVAFEMEVLGIWKLLLEHWSMHSAGGAKVMQTNHHFKIVEWPVASWWNTTDIDCGIVEGVCSGTRWEVWIPVLIFPAGYQGLSLVYVWNHFLRERCWLRVNFLSAKGKAVTWLKLASPKEERPDGFENTKGTDQQDTVLMRSSQCVDNDPL